MESTLNLDIKNNYDFVGGLFEYQHTTAQKKVAYIGSQREIRAKKRAEKVSQWGLRTEPWDTKKNPIKWEDLLLE